MDRILAVGIEQAAMGPAELPSDLLVLIEQRTIARENRDFATADRIREELSEHGVLIEDRPDGVRWRYAKAKNSPKL